MISIALIILLSLVMTGAFSLAPYVPTRKEDLPRILDICQLRSGEKVLEIGAGDGRFSFFVADARPDCEVTAIELSPAFYLLMLCRNAIKPRPNLHIVFWNALNIDFSRYDALYVFGIEGRLDDKLLHKFESELRPEGRIVSYAFELLGWTGQKTKHKNRESELAVWVHAR